MDRADREKGEGFHELPLVLFTALAIAGAGVGTAHLGLFFSVGFPWFRPGRVMALTGILLAGRPSLLRRPPGAPLPQRLGPDPGRKEPSFQRGAGGDRGPGGQPRLGGPSRRTCPGGPLTAHGSGELPPHAPGAGPGVPAPRPADLGRAGPGQPLVLGVAFGLTVLLGTMPAGTRARGELLILSMLLVDGLLVWRRTRRAPGCPPPGSPGPSRAHGIERGPGHLQGPGGDSPPAGALLREWPELAGIFLFSTSSWIGFSSMGLLCGVTPRPKSRVESALEGRNRSRPSRASTPLSTILRSGER